MCFGVRAGQKLPPCPPSSLDETMEDEVYKNKKRIEKVSRDGRAKNKQTRVVGIITDEMHLIFK